MRRLLSWVLGRARAKAQPLLAVQIDDARGCNVLALEDSGSLIDVPLPPGIYQVTASLGAARRSYTMALEAGTPVELHVRLPADPG